MFGQYEFIHIMVFWLFRQLPCNNGLTSFCLICCRIVWINLNHQMSNGNIASRVVLLRYSNLPFYWNVMLQMLYWNFHNMNCCLMCIVKKIDGSTNRQKDLDTFVNIIYDFACTIFLCDESLIQTHIVPSN